MTKDELRREREMLQKEQDFHSKSSRIRQLRLQRLQLQEELDGVDQKIAILDKEIEKLA